MLQLNYKKYGEGKPLIILHGFLGSLDNWHTLAGEWGKNGFEVYTIDLRNHGKSPHTEYHSIDLMVEDLKDFIQQQNLSTANLLGHSMGGKVVMKFALTYPNLVDKLIVADIYKRGHDDVFEAILNVNLDAAQSRKEVEEAMKPFLGDFGTRQFILKGLDRGEDEKYRWKFNFETLYRDYTDVIQSISSNNPFKGNTLFIKGGLSLYIKETDIADIRKLFPNVRIQTIENAGHWLHADKPKEFFEAVKLFLTAN
jgi:esterase